LLLLSLSIFVCVFPLFASAAPPIINSMAGCATVSSSTSTSTGCDGSGSYSSFTGITMGGGWFYPTYTSVSPSVTVVGSKQTYYGSVYSYSSHNTTLVLYPFSIDYADVNTTLPLTVSTSQGKSNTWYVSFNTYSTNNEAVAGLASTIVAIIVVFSIIAVLILCAVTMAIMSCFCGVSFAFFRCCCPVQQPTVVTTPVYRGPYINMTPANYAPPTFVPGQGYVAYR